MDVTNAEQAKIAEDAGACAVMALERVPADIRAQGGVARMSNPAVIKEIQEAVTIPVMAKARIGHFAEAQVLQSLEVDYVDESEVLTPADESNHIDKFAFEVPVRLRRHQPRRGAPPDRRGRRDDPLEGRGGHRQHRRGRSPHARDHRRHQAPRLAAIGAARRRRQGAPGAARGRPGGRRARLAAGSALLRRRHRHAGGRRADDAARRRGQLRRLGDLQERGPAHGAPARSSRRPPTSRTPSASRRPRWSSATRCPASRSRPWRPTAACCRAAVLE